MIIHEENFIADPLSIANDFKDFFSTVAHKVKSKIKFYSKSFSDFLPASILESIILSQITKDEISSLNSSKSAGPNIIPTTILKLIQVHISKHLTDIFTLSFTTGVFPNSWKSAKVIPIQKKKPNLVMSNYRPISLVSNLYKIIEKLMYNQIIQFLEDKTIIYYKQFGFHKNFSTAHAIITLIEKV